MAAPDPRIPEAVRTARLDNIRLVSVAAADFVIRAHIAVVDLPVGAEPAQVSGLRIVSSTTLPAGSQAAARLERIKAWGAANGLSGEALNDFVLLITKGLFSYRDALEAVTRPKAPA